MLDYEDQMEIVAERDRLRAEVDQMRKKLSGLKLVTMDMIDAAIDKNHPAAPSEQLLSALDAAAIYYR